MFSSYFPDAWGCIYDTPWSHWPEQQKKAALYKPLCYGMNTVLGSSRLQETDLYAIHMTH